MAYQVGTAIYEHYVFYDSTTEAPKTGLLLADLIGLSFMLNFATDKSSLLAMAEIGTTGEYVISFTPDAAGHYSLIFTEPADTLGYHQKATYEVLLTTEISTPVTTLDDMVISHVKDVGGILTATDRAEAIASAIIAVYSKFVPRKMTHSYVAALSTDETYSITLSSLTNWLDGFSEVVAIENPINEDPPTIFDVDEYYTDALGMSFVTPLTGSYDLIYTALHSSDGSTLTDLGKRQVSYLAAGFYLEKMAAYYLQHKNSKMGEATSDFRSRSDECATRAREYMAMFYAFFGGNGRDISIGTTPAFFRVKLNTGLTAEAAVPVTTRRLTH